MWLKPNIGLVWTRGTKIPAFNVQFIHTSTTQGVVHCSKMAEDHLK